MCFNFCCCSYLIFHSYSMFVCMLKVVLFVRIKKSFCNFYLFLCFLIIFYFIFLFFKGFKAYIGPFEAQLGSPFLIPNFSFFLGLFAGRWNGKICPKGQQARPNDWVISLLLLTTLFCMNFLFFFLRGIKLATVLPWSLAPGYFHTRPWILLSAVAAYSHVLHAKEAVTSLVGYFSSLALA